MSIDAGDRWAEYEIKEREQVGRYMYDHQEDYVSRSRYEKTVDQLTKAKEHIKKLLGCLQQDTNDPQTNYYVVQYMTEAEQFLKEALDNDR